MDASERDEMRRLRREMELSSLGDRPSSMSAMKLQRLIDLEAKEIHAYAVNVLSPSPSYTLAELAKLAEQWAIEDKILATDRWLVSSLIAWLAKKERKGNERGIQI